jgi:hypothetical protein
MDILFNYLKDGIIGQAGKILTYMSKASIDLFSNDLVTNILALFDWIGLILLAVGILFAIANIYIDYLENDCINAHLLIINIIKGIIAYSFIRVGAIALYDLSSTLNTYISKIASTPDYNAQLSNLNNTLSGASLGIVWTFIIGIVALGAVIVCLIQIMKRGGLYMAQIIIGYLYIFSIPSGNTDGFFEWCKTTVAMALTNVVQTALLYIGLSLMSNDLSKIFLGIGVIMAAESVEKVAGRYGMSAKASKKGGMSSMPFRNMGSAASFGGGASAGASSVASAPQVTSLIPK